MVENSKELVKTLLYVGTDGAVELNVVVDQENETFWTTQKTMSSVFKVSNANVSKHLNNIFESGELNKEEVSFNPNDSTNSGIVIINPKAKTQPILYNLDAIISLGYRVNSKEATQFRKWATTILRDYIIKGFAIDTELLKNGTRIGIDYFKQVLEIIRDIRLSERRLYEQVTDIYATAYDYNKDAEITKGFFMNVQNKLHYAVTGLTAPEIIAERASSEKPNMGLSTWDKAPGGKVYYKDTKTAKNYLVESEMSELRRIVNMYLDYAENQASRQIPMSMKDWVDKLDKFLEFNEYYILQGKGKISREDVNKFVKEEYEKYRPIQDKMYKSDYNKFIEESENLKKLTKKNN